MCETVAEVRAHALALLLRGYSPEEVEEALNRASYLEGCVLDELPPTALSDPTNVLMQEVTEDGTRRG
jgi:hypothetical protein